MKKYLVTIIGIFSMPFLVQAQVPAKDVKTLITYLGSLFNRFLIPLMITLATIYVMYAVVGFIGADQNSQKKEEKKQQIFWGIIGLFVIITVWSLVAVVANTFDVLSGEQVLRPQ